MAPQGLNVPGVPSMGRRRGLNVPGAAAAAMPSGALGIYYASDYVTSPVKVIPNQATAVATSPNMMPAPSGLFTRSYYYNPSLVTAVDRNATAPDGSGDATSVTNASAADWNVNVSTFPVLPAGTYTCAIWVRWKGTTGDPTFRFGANGQLGSGTATTSWQRFSSQFTSNGSTGLLMLPMYRPLASTTIANFEIWGFSIYAGSSDLEPTAGIATASPAGHMTFGHCSADAGPTFASNSIAFNGSLLATGLTQFPTSISSAVTIIYVAKHTGSPINSTYNPLVAQVGTSFTNFTHGVTGSTYGFWWNAAHPQYNQGAGEGFERGGYNILAISYDLTTCKLYFNGTLVSSNASTLSAAVAMRELWIGMLQDSYVSNYNIAALAIYPTALSDADVVQATTAIRAKMVTNGITLDIDTRAEIIEGDSISYGTGDTNVDGYAMRAITGTSPLNSGVNLAVGGSSIASVIARQSAVTSLIAAHIAKGRLPIVHLLIGANDLGIMTTNGQVDTWLSSIQSYAATCRTAGAKFVLGTVLPRTDGGDAGTQFNARRNYANPIIRSWVGTNIDACSDFASDANMGIDAGSNNLTYFGSDKVHPTSTGHATLAPYKTTAVNAV